MSKCCNAEECGKVLKEGKLGGPSRPKSVPRANPFLNSSLEGFPISCRIILTCESSNGSKEAEGADQLKEAPLQYSKVYESPNRFRLNSTSVNKQYF